MASCEHATTVWTRTEHMITAPNAGKASNRSDASAARRPRLRTLGMFAVTVVVAAACSSGTSGTTTTTTGTHSTTSTGRLPGIHHVFVIMLENEGFSATFGNTSADPYLASTLPSQGALLRDYYATGHLSNDNYASFISGQAPNSLNQADCPTFSDFPATATVDAAGQISGSGCVFPSTVTTVADQLTTAGDTWRGYMEDMGNIPGRESPACGHPTIGAIDGTQRAVPGDGYATRHDPFAYFHSIIDNPSMCNSHVVPLGTTSGKMPSGTPSGTTGLASDLSSISTTPNFTFITPNLCDDGHDAPCINQAGQSEAPANIDAFLRQWVPLITGSPAFKKDGLLEVTFDESGIGDSTSCCNETAGPGAANPGLGGPGGGLTGTILLSPFIHGGTTSMVPYNHFSSLATIEDLFRLPRLGQARTVSAAFGTDVFGGH
jgi:phosphatidylinositol-3-phosphatase